jgi:hypothetical protein
MTNIGGRTFASLSLPSSNELSELLSTTSLPTYVISGIWSIQRIPSRSTIVVLARLSSSSTSLPSITDYDVLLQWHQTNEEWSILSMFAPTKRLWSLVLGNTAPLMIQGSSSSGSLIMAGNALYYSPNGGASLHNIQLRSRSIPSSPLYYQTVPFNIVIVFDGCACTDMI